MIDPIECPQCNGNLALIKAAPDLLAALEDAMQYLPASYIYDQTAIRNRAKAAISRAKGRCGVYC